jgi:hypothetical protein
MNQDETRSLQTIAMAQEIVQTMHSLQKKYPQAQDLNSMWIAMISLYDINAARYVQALSVNVARRDL